MRETSFSFILKVRDELGLSADIPSYKKTLRFSNGDCSVIFMETVNGSDSCRLFAHFIIARAMVKKSSRPISKWP